MITVRLEPLPPRRILLFGTSNWFEEEAFTTRLLAAVSASPTVKPMGPVHVSSGVLLSATSEIVGGELLPTASKKVSLAESAPSLTWTVIAAEPDEIPVPGSRGKVAPV